MSSSGLLPNSSPTVRVFEHELNLQESRHLQSWTKLDHISFLICRLSLYTFALSTSCAGQDADTFEDERRTCWLPQAYRTATTCIELISSLRDEIQFATIQIKKCLANAVLFLLQLLQYAQPLVAEIATIRNHVSRGWETLSRCSLAKDDHMSRVCAVIEYLCSSVEEHSQYKAETFTTVKARMAANLAVDSVFRARYRFSQAVRDQLPADYTEAAKVEEVVLGLEHDLDSPAWLAGEPFANMNWNDFGDELWLT
jgi:hypothetical protein